MPDFKVGDVVKMKKQHPCGTNKWQILRVGMDFRIKCLNCGRSIMMPRSKFEKRVKEILEKAE